MSVDLFSGLTTVDVRPVGLADGAVLLPRFARSRDAQLLAAIADVTAQSPFRHMITPGGFTMSVAVTNCGAAGWTSDRSGYRYDRIDPVTRELWPGLPEAFRALAIAAAREGGYATFEPDACLINRYETGARLSLHQDKNERDLSKPIVSVSLGMPATFLFGGPKRTDPTRKIRLEHGDVAVWGGPSRLYFHGVAPLRGEPHDVLGPHRINLTFRGAL